MEKLAEQLVREKLLVKAKFKGATAYRWPDPLPRQTVIAKRARGGAAYEREVADATRKLRESLAWPRPKRK